MTDRKAHALRALIEKAAASLSDGDALDAVELYPEWEVDRAYKADARIRYVGRLYRVVQDHTSQADWIPSEVPALYAEVAKPGEIPDWKQPTGAQDAYQKGDKVRHNGKIWTSLIDGNVWEPGTPGLWEETA